MTTFVSNTEACIDLLTKTVSNSPKLHLRALSIYQNWPAGPIIVTMKSAFSKGFAEEPSPSCILFRI